MKKSYEQHKQHAFDCFCKKILKNEMRDYYLEINKRRKHEISFSKLSISELSELCAYDEYFSDGHSLRGAGMMKSFMVATFTDLILRVVLAITLSVPFGTLGIWLSWPIGWSVATVLSIIFYRRGQWNREEC